MWERGLKQFKRQPRQKYRRSLPMWERGLKLRSILILLYLVEVAPHVGAWIETF